VGVVPPAGWEPPQREAPPPSDSAQAVPRDSRLLLPLGGSPSGPQRTLSLPTRLLHRRKLWREPVLRLEHRRVPRLPAGVLRVDLSKRRHHYVLQ
jgi:hypothetical protein